jgi:hypothetical protein
MEMSVKYVMFTAYYYNDLEAYTSSGLTFLDSKSQGWGYRSLPIIKGTVPKVSLLVSE